MSEEATATATAEVSAEIKDLGDKLVELTLKQAVDLGNYLKEEYGIEPAAGAVAVAGGGGGGEAAAEEEKDSFDVMLTGAGDKKIQVIKVVRELTGLGLKEAKDLVDNLPKPIKEGAAKDEADQIKGKLEEAGGAVELK